MPTALVRFPSPGSIAICLDSRLSCSADLRTVKSEGHPVSVLRVGQVRKQVLPGFQEYNFIVGNLESLPAWLSALFESLPPPPSLSVMSCLLSFLSDSSNPSGLSPHPAEEIAVLCSFCLKHFRIKAENQGFNEFVRNGGHKLPG